VSDPGQPLPARPQKSAAAFRTIGEVAEELDLPAHVLRFWETKFPQLRPVKRSGGRRYYRPADIRLLRQIRQWLHHDGYTIRGVQQLLENGPPHILGSDENPDIAGPVAAASDAGTEAGPGVDIASGLDAEGVDRPQFPSSAEADHRPTALDPETRAELEELRRDLLHARTLLDALLRQFKTS
jgi:DNA-binding transcriptional MerR regulator